MSLVFKTPKSTLNTTTGEGQNIGYGDCPECPECPKVELSDVDVEYTENGEYTLTPEGDGFSSVGITVNIDTKAIEDAAYAEGEAAGIITGKAQGVAEQKAKLESATFVSNGTYTKEDGYNEVTVNVPSDVNNQTKNVTISSNGTETITADSGYSGLGSVEVTVDVPEKQLTDTLKTYTENGEYTITPQEGYDGFSEVNVSVQIDEQAIYQDGFNSGLDAGIAEQKAKLTSTTISSNDTFTNEDGWNEVIVDVQPNLDVLEVTPSTQSQQFLPESRYDGFSQVDVNAVTSAIDNNITASNIKKDVTILGVTGTYDPQPTLQAKTVDPTTSQQVITADSGNDGLSQVTVEGVTSAIDSNITASNIKSGVTILGVTGTVTEGITPTGNINITNTNSTDVTNYATAQVVDANLTAGNIKSGTTILGVQGSYDPQPDLETKSVTYTTNDTYTITPTAGKDGMSSVEVTVNVAGGGGTQCPDWSSIGWDCNDVNNSSLVNDFAYAAQASAGIHSTDMRLIIAPKISKTLTTISYSGCTNLRYVPEFDLSYISSPTAVSSLFSGCTIVDHIRLINAGEQTNMSYMFSGCHSLTDVYIDDTSSVTNMASMFKECVSLQTAPMMDTSSVTNMSEMFSTGALRGNVGMYRYTEMHLTTIPQYNTSNVTNLRYMFYGGAYHTNAMLTTIPQLNLVKADQLSGMLSKCTGLTTLGGFINLGKGFLSTTASADHTLDLSSSTVLTYQSIMNVINNLAAPDDTAVTDATLKLSATSYALLTEEDIAIATAKRWSVVS